MARPDPAVSPSTPDSLLVVRDQAEIDRYLLAHPALAPMLRDVQHRLVELYEPGVTFDVALRYFADDADEPMLRVLVVTTLDGDEALARQRRFDEWWIDQRPEFQTQMLVNYRVHR